MFISQHIKEAAQTTGYTAQEIEPNNLGSIRNSIENKFAFPASKPLWERFKSHTSSICDSNGWKYIADFPIKEKIILFFDDDDEKAMYLINNPHQFVAIIGECPAIEFYLTNERFNFLICFNDHDYLIGAGEAESWIKEL